MTNPASNTISQLKHLASLYDSTELDHCLDHQLTNNSNTCIAGSDNQTVINLLAKAGFVRKLVDSGYSVNAAVRELGKRMRMLA